MIKPGESANRATSYLDLIRSDGLHNERSVSQDRGDVVVPVPKTSIRQEGVSDNIRTTAGDDLEKQEETVRIAERELHLEREKQKLAWMRRDQARAGRDC
jgi:hypothetical protein